MKVSQEIRKARSSLILGVCLSVAAVLPQAAQAQARYSMSVVKGLDSVAVWDMNESGQFVGQRYLGGDKFEAVKVADGVATSLGLPWKTSGAQAINDAGQIVGWVRGEDTNHHGFLYDNGNVTIMGIDRSGANAINNAGLVVGDYYDQNWSSPQMFLHQNGVTTYVHTPEKYEYPVGVNDSGQILFQREQSKVYMYDNGTVTLVHNNLDAPVMNSSGAVVGYSWLVHGEPGWDTYTQSAVMVQNGTTVDLGMLFESESRAYDINDKGQVVGWAAGKTYRDGNGWLYENGHMYDLSHLVDESLGDYFITSAQFITNSGRIFAGACTRDFSDCQDVFLNPLPVPEPGTTTMLLAGLALLGAYRGRSAFRKAA